MKICPTCKMTVDAENECPICYTTITYEPKVSADKEKYVYNKYFFWHVIKNSWFSVACFIIVALRLISKHQFSPQYLLCYVGIFILLLISVLISVFQRRLSRFLQWKYSKDYSEYLANYSKIILCAVAVLQAFLI